MNQPQSPPRRIAVFLLAGAAVVFILAIFLIPAPTRPSFMRDAQRKVYDGETIYVCKGDYNAALDGLMKRHQDGFQLVGASDAMDPDWSANIFESQAATLLLYQQSAQEVSSGEFRVRYIPTTILSKIGAWLGR